MKPIPRLFLLLPLTLALQTAWAADDIANQNTETDTELSPVVVVASKHDHATVQMIDPKTALQPLPAQDGADLLKAIPGMSVIRKGGSSGDPLLRGLGGSRLLISADDQFVLGGCPARMDPPTSYLFPASYDRVIVTKGPQSVSQGPGMIAGSVRFVRDEHRLQDATAKLDAGMTAASFGRIDGYVDATLGNQYGWLRANASHNESDDYKDGNGDTVHSAFKRDNQMLQAALTPTDNTLIAAQYERSRGKAKYADRSMDGSQFDRDAWSVKVRQQNLTDWLTEVQLEYGRSKIDHVMDNFSLREAPEMNMGGMGHGGMSMGGGMGGMMPMKPKRMYAVMNPARDIQNGKLSAKLELGNTSSNIGLDWQQDDISSRPMVMGNNEAAARAFDQAPFEWNQTYKRHGVYAETKWQINDDNSLSAGLRHDWTRVAFNPEKFAYTADKMNQSEGLNAGFVRFERRMGDTTAYVGYGLAQRSPDYWERMKNHGEALSKETNHQIDTGVLYQNDTLSAALNVFASRINDFILVVDDGSLSAAARQINAQRYGFEAQADWRFAPQWTVGSSLAYTRGKNLSDGVALAQTPPLEWRTSLNWENERLSVGALWRVVASQERYTTGQGNIVGMDTGRTGGFGTLSLNAGWKIHKNATLQVGVDNVFNKTYAEAVNKSAYSMETQSIQNRRVNEPGRTIWARAQIRF